MTPQQKQRIEQIRERRSRVTSPPWEVSRDSMRIGEYRLENQRKPEGSTWGDFEAVDEAHRDFIENAVGDIDFLLSLGSQEAATLQYFNTGSDGRCVTCGNLKLWQYHVDEEIDPAMLMRSACVEKVKAMQRAWREQYEIIDMNGSGDRAAVRKELLLLFTKIGTANDIARALESVTIQEQEK